MKILLIQTNYPNFLDEFYKKFNFKNKSYKQIKTKWANELFGNSNFYLKNLIRYGWTGDEVIANDSISQVAWAKEHNINIKDVKIPFKKLIPGRIANLLNLNSEYKKIIFEQIKHIKPDVVYIFDITYFSLNELHHIKTLTQIVVGQIAYPLPLDKSVFKGYDLIISSLPNYVKYFKEMGLKSEYLKWCFEKSILKKIKSKKRIYKVSYVGGFSPHHSKGNQILEKLASKVKINFWGYGVGFLKPNSPIRKRYHGEAWGSKMFEIFAKSKIVVNRHINLSKNFANNMRMFDVTGMGALLITDHKSNISDFFIDGKEVITYKNAVDLADKVKYFIKNDKEREQIAKKGQLKTLKDHTYEIRMKELNQILRKYL